MEPHLDRPTSPNPEPQPSPKEEIPCRILNADSVAHHSVCLICGGEGRPFRAKLICSQCNAIIQTCCD